ncbi:MAG: 50S ribosomal protein L25 [Candidatus Moranbacteria bacterium]|nr:50S ribosomal protein L25 [Candidatus Moranbacteria bacterium]
MTKKTIIQADPRDVEKQKPKQIREAEAIPAIVYGSKIKPTHLTINKKQAKKIAESLHESSLMSLNIDGEAKTRKVILQDYQQDKLTNKLLHLDFFEVDMKKEIQTQVPIEFKGVSPAVKNSGGILVKNINELDIKCLPDDLPEAIEIDLSQLENLNDSLYVNDLKINQNVTILNSPDSAIVTINEPRSEKELEQIKEEVETDVSQVEGVEDKEESKEGEEDDADSSKQQEAEKKDERQNDTKKE